LPVSASIPERVRLDRKKKLTDTYLDPDAPINTRVKDLLARMTLAEKVSQLGNSCDGIERLKLPAFRDGEVEHGAAVIGNQDPAVGAATVFPQAIAMAATFDNDLVRAVAEAISDEVRAKYEQGFMGLAFCSPVIDLARDPRWGRVQECFGEDPLLAAVLGAAFIRGLSGENKKYLKCVAGPKHLTANSCEETRRDGNITVDQRSFWDYYIRPFEKCFEIYPYNTIMPAYNGVNGMPGAANRWLLNDVLRDMIGFSGYVLSDGLAVYDLYRAHHIVSSMEEAAALSLMSGCDVSNGKGLKEYGLEAVEQGLIPEHVVDIAASRALKARFQLGLLDPEEERPYKDVPVECVCGEKHLSLSFQTALESIVLLKNNGILPLKKKRPRILLTGNFADSDYLGTYSGIPVHVVTAKEGVLKQLGDGAELRCHPILTADFAPALIPSKCFSTASGRPGVTAEFFESRHLLGKPIQTTIYPDINFDWRFTCPIEGREGETPWGVRFSGTINAPESKTIKLYVNSDNGVRLSIAGYLLIDEWGGAPPRTLTADFSFEKGKSYNFTLERGAQGEGCRVALGWDYVDSGEFAETMRFAGEADYIIACLGTGKGIEDEAVDRHDITLPVHQESLLKALYSQNPNIIAVLFSGGPVTSIWADEHLPAVLQAWYAGDQGGRALAKILIGEHSPSGRMPVTVYRDSDSLPSINTYDIISNKMTYMYYEKAVLYPFGHGLSYTAFRYTELESDKSIYEETDTARLSVTIENTGDMASDEVVQFYARAANPAVPMPRRQLIAFKRVSVPPRESVRVHVFFLIRDLFYYNIYEKRRTLLKGRYSIVAGASGEDIRAEISVTCG
jgi:beta-glucosidase